MRWGAAYVLGRRVCAADVRVCAGASRMCSGRPRVYWGVRMYGGRPRVRSALASAPAVASAGAFASARSPRVRSLLRHRNRPLDSQGHIHRQGPGEPLAMERRDQDERHRGEDAEGDEA